MLLYLTSSTTGCVGGETVFYPDEITFGGKKNAVQQPVVVGLETGMCLLHKHGDDCMLVCLFYRHHVLLEEATNATFKHEGREVREGEKWVIRSDLCVKR